MFDSASGIVMLGLVFDSGLTEYMSELKNYCIDKQCVRCSSPQKIRLVTWHTIFRLSGSKMVLAGVNWLQSLASITNNGSRVSGLVDTSSDLFLH